jgi:uncharacterized protein (TIGR02466 family)
MLPFVVNDDHDVKQPMKILDFYPIPVGVVPLKRTLKDQEIDHVNILKNNTTINAGKNKISVDKNVLNSEAFCELKEIITEHLNDYIKTIFNPDRDIQVYITNSWINWTENDTGHHQHAHPNSLISCVLYIETDFTSDSITFSRPQGSYLFGNVDGFSNSPSTKYGDPMWSIPVDKNNLIIFPSQMYHQVIPRHNTSKGTRISLSMNTWFKGSLGCSDYVSELKL